MKYRGFSLVELLIVIVVIAILAAIGFVSYQGISVRAKNAQIISGVKAYHNAILAYRGEVGSYPPGGGGCLGSGYAHVSDCWQSLSGTQDMAFSAVAETALSNYLSNQKPTVSVGFLRYATGYRSGLYYSSGVVPSEYYLIGQQTCTIGQQGGFSNNNTQCVIYYN